MKFRIKLPSQDELKLLFEYRDDGKLISKYSRSSRKIGDEIGVLNKYGYLSAKIKNKTYYVHRLIWTLCNGDIPNGFDIDHINGCRSDNSMSNLRLVTRSENNRNLRVAKKNSKTKLLGASFHKATGKYVAQINDNGKVKHLGLFESALDAHNAYLIAKRKLHKTCTI